MKRCAYCNTLILFGGVNVNGVRFCNAKCHNGGLAIAASQSIPEDVVRKHVDEIHTGLCPRCHGRGPIDVHISYFIWSALILTSWSSRPKICCRSCGIKTQLSGALGSFLVGWWGFPWGLILTPVQLTRNIVRMCSPPDSSRPSELLQRLVRINIASAYIAQQRQIAGQPVGRQEMSRS